MRMGYFDGDAMINIIRDALELRRRSREGINRR